MSHYKYVVLTKPRTEADDAEFNRWYEEQHIPDVLRIPGFLSAERFDLAADQRKEPPFPYKYLAIYEIETDDLRGALDELARRYDTVDMVMSETLSPELLGLIFESRGPEVRA